MNKKLSSARKKRTENRHETSDISWNEEGSNTNNDNKKKSGGYYKIYTQGDKQGEAMTTVINQSNSQEQE